MKFQTYIIFFSISCIKRIDFRLAIDVLTRDFRTNLKFYFSAYAFEWALQFHFRTFDYRIKQLPPRSAVCKKKQNTICAHMCVRVSKMNDNMCGRRGEEERARKGVESLILFYDYNGTVCYFIMLTLNDNLLEETFDALLKKSVMNSTS